MNTRFTPGPWALMPDNPLQITDMVNDAVPMYFVEVVVGDGGRECALADARLIAAAPKLYEAARLALLALNTSEQSWHAKQRRTEEARKACIAALAKVDA